jgi:hypothetical protein
MVSTRRFRFVVVLAAMLLIVGGSLTIKARAQM